MKWLWSSGSGADIPEVGVAVVGELPLVLDDQDILQQH